MKKPILSLLALAALGLGGCASTKTTGAPVQGVPDWVLNPPKGNGLYGVGILQSKSLQLAKEQADFAGCKEIASVLSQKLEGLTSQYIGQAGAVGSAEAMEDLKSAARSVVNVRLTGCANQKRDVRQMDDGSYKVFSLQYLDPAGAMAAAKAARESKAAQAQSKAAFEELDRLLARDLGAGEQEQAR